MTLEEKDPFSTEGSGLLRAPVMAQIETTQGCNHHCGYCYNPFRKSPARRSLAANQLLPILERLEDLGILAVTLTGGEPLTNVPALQAAVKWATTRGMLLSINTNASLLDSALAEVLVEHKVFLLISLPCSTPAVFRQVTASENYGRVIANIKHVVRLGGMFLLNMVVGDINVQHVRRTALFAVNELGAPRSAFRATPVSPPPYIDRISCFCLSDEGFKEYYRQIFSLMVEDKIEVGTLGTIPFCSMPEFCRSAPLMLLGCTAGRGTIVIGAEGDIRPCSQAAFSIGNIFNVAPTGLRGLLDAQLQPWRSHKYLPKDCRACAEAWRCGGGCRMFAHHCTGFFDGRDPRMSNPLLASIPSVMASASQVPPFRDLSGRSFRVHPHVRWRRERDDCWLVFNGAYYDFLTMPGMQLFETYFIRNTSLPCSPSSRLAAVVRYFVARGYASEYPSHA